MGLLAHCEGAAKGQVLETPGIEAATTSCSESSIDQVFAFLIM